MGIYVVLAELEYRNFIGWKGCIGPFKDIAPADQWAQTFKEALQGVECDAEVIELDHIKPWKRILCLVYKLTLPSKNFKFLRFLHLRNNYRTI